MFVLDKFLNSIVWIDEELKKNTIQFKLLNNKKLQNIEKDNYNKISRIIKENNPNGYYHLSTKPFTTLRNTSKEGNTYIGNTNLYYHPIGLYFSCGIKYFENDKSIHYTYLYELIFNKSVLKINNLNDFKKFIQKYKFSNSNIRIHNILNWVEIKKQYNGIIICPNLRKQLFKNTKSLIEIYEDENIIMDKIIETYGLNWMNNLELISEWFRHWHNEGVIWNPEGIKSIKLINKINYDL